MVEGFKNILIIKPSSLGDVVQALPALSALRRNLPDAKISWLIRPEFAPLLENHPQLNQIIIFDRKFLGKAWFNPRAFVALLSLIWRLRRSKFNVIFDFQGLFRTACLSWLSGCKNRFGPANSRELAHIFYTRKIPQTENCVHLVDYYLKIIQAAGASDLDVQFIMPQDPTATDSINKLLAKHKITQNQYVVFVPGSAHPDKRWPLERFAALAEKISSLFHLPILVTGTKTEAGFIENLKTLANVPVIDLAGKTSLSELVALLKNARLVVSNDTGPGHIAAALGMSVILIFGRSNPARVAPYGRIDSLVAIEPFSRGFVADSTDPKHDIKNVSVDDVFQKVCEQLKL